MADYVYVYPTRIGWRRISATVWLDRCGKIIELSLAQPLVHVPTDYEGLDQ